MQFNNLVKKYIYKVSILKEHNFLVSAVKLEPTFDSILSVLLLLDKDIVFLEDNIILEKIALVLKDKCVLDKNNEPINFDEYLCLFDNGTFAIVDNETFNHTFEIYESKSILHAEWINIAEMGGQLYKEFIIDEIYFIVVNDNNEKYLFYTLNQLGGMYSAVKVSITTLVALLEGYVDLHKVFNLPVDDKYFNIAFDMIDKKQFICTKPRLGELKRPKYNTFVRPNVLKIEDYKNRLEHEYGNKKKEININNE